MATAGVVPKKIGEFVQLSEHFLLGSGFGGAENLRRFERNK
jgi:hypothetical protein